MVPKAILWELLMKFQHQPVPRHLGKDAGCGDRKAFRVAIDQGRLWMQSRKNVWSIHQGMVRRGRELQECFVHRAQTGPKNIDRIDHRDIDDRNRVGNQWRGSEKIVKAVPLPFSKLLGIVQTLQLPRQPFQYPIPRKANDSGDYGTCEWTTASLIRAGYPRAAALKACTLMFESAGPHRVVAKSGC